MGKNAGHLFPHWGLTVHNKIKCSVQIRDKTPVVACILSSFQCLVIDLRRFFMQQYQNQGRKKIKRTNKVCVHWGACIIDSGVRLH